MADIAPKRFTPHQILIGQPDDWIRPQLPYEADTDLTEPNAQIRRVIVSLHGTGGDARQYYNNGKAVVETRNALSPGAVDNAPVVSNQLDLMHDAFTHRLRVRVLYNPDNGSSWKRFYDVRVYRDD